jgi:hypothetical protein
MTEDCLLTGALEPTNEAYAIAKIAGLKLCQYYRRQYGVLFHSAMPTNLYGPGDNYHPENSHVLPALIRRFHEAARAGRSEVVAWGTGSAEAGIPARRRSRRRLCVSPAPGDPPDWINVGTGVGRHDQGIDGAGGRHGRLPRTDKMGPFEARRHPPQAAGRDEAVGPGLEVQHRPARRDQRDLPGLPGGEEIGEPAPLAQPTRGRR